MLEFELTFNVTEYVKRMPKGVSTTPAVAVHDQRPVHLGATYGTRIKERWEAQLR